MRRRDRKRERIPSKRGSGRAISSPHFNIQTLRMRAFNATGNHFYSPSCQKKNTPPPPPERMGAWGGTHALEVLFLGRSSGVGDNRDGATTERGTTLLTSCCCCFCSCFSTRADADAASLRAAGEELGSAAAWTTSSEGLLPRDRETALQRLRSRKMRLVILLSCCCDDAGPDVDATVGE